MQAVRREIAQRSGAKLIILPPAMKILVFEGRAVLDGPKPPFVINGLGSRLIFEGVVPFAGLAVTGVPGLGPDGRADFAALYQFGAFVITARRATLRTSLENFA